jgi:hypothetical protein
MRLHLFRRVLALHLCVVEVLKVTPSRERREGALPSSLPCQQEVQQRKKMPLLMMLKLHLQLRTRGRQRWCEETFQLEEVFPIQPRLLLTLGGVGQEAQV